MKDIETIKAKIETATTEYHRATDADTQYKKTQEVKALRQQLSAAIADGAKSCGVCNTVPMGAEQPRDRNEGTHYEVGCTVCPDRRIRGGLLPRHSVEKWNETMTAKAVMMKDERGLPVRKGGRVQYQLVSEKR